MKSWLVLQIFNQSLNHDSNIYGFLTTNHFTWRPFNEDSKIEITRGCIRAPPRFLRRHF